MNAPLDPPKKPSEPVEKALIVFFGLLLVPPALWSFKFVYLLWTTDEVVSTRSIGNFVSMSGPGGLRDTVVIETDLGSFPLNSAAAITKGTALVLEERASGERYVCDTARSLCIETGSAEFQFTKPTPPPSTGGAP